ncbi:MAG: N-acetyltransferase family protein [Myxococcota bacterium]
MSETRDLDAGGRRGGEPIRIRPIRPDDKARLRAAFHRLSLRSVYFRFFSALPDLSDAMLAYFTEVDSRDHVGLVAVEPEGDDERIVGVGRYIRTGEARAEVALAVVDDHQGHGIGTALLDDLVAAARGNGIERFEADVLRENRKMLEVFSHTGFPLQRSVEREVIRVTFPIRAEDRLSSPSP